jgi:ribonuclease HI
VGRREESLMEGILAGLTWRDAARKAALPETDARRFLESVARFAGVVGAGMEFGERGRDAAEASHASLVVHTDGASLGNPGPAGAGGVIETPDGLLVEEFHEHLGRTTNNIAEYEAVRIGLGKALAHGARRVTVRLDSELVANQLRGTYKIKDRKLLDAYLRVEGLLSELDAVVFETVPREQNTRADRLAQLGARRGPSEE